VAVSRRSSRSRYTLVLLVLTSITLLTLDFRGFGPLESARSSVLSFFAPVGDFASGVFSPVADTWNGAFASGDLQAENDDLRRQIDELQGKVASGEAATADLEALKRERGLETLADTEVVFAEVTSGALSNFDESIQINKGASSGIKKDMPVLSGGVLVGTVMTVADNHATVRLITDPSFQAGVSVAGIPGKGVVRGRGDEQTLFADSFSITTDLQPDQQVVTSGAARSAFPPDIPVGTIRAVTTDDTTQQKTADVELLANMDDLKYVTVLLHEPDAVDGEAPGEGEGE
jgi:rod shape-determining protein MreC